MQNEDLSVFSAITIDTWRNTIGNGTIKHKSKVCKYSWLTTVIGSTYWKTESWGIEGAQPPYIQAFTSSSSLVCTTIATFPIFINYKTLFCNWKWLCTLLHIVDWISWMICRICSSACCRATICVIVVGNWTSVGLNWTHCVSTLDKQSTIRFRTPFL